MADEDFPAFPGDRILINLTPGKRIMRRALDDPAPEAALVRLSRGLQLLQRGLGARHVLFDAAAADANAADHFVL